jgi:phage terminase small subunit
VAKALDTKQLAFVAAIKAGQNGAEAAIAAGYSPKSARFAARRLRANPLVIAEIERVHTELREHTQYGLEAAVAECDEVLTMARERGDVKAMAKPLELKLRLHGLLRDKLDITVERVDINGALTDARNRVSLRPMRDLPTSIAGDAIGAQAPHVAGPIDTQSTARRRGDDGGSFFEAGIYD